MLFNECCLTSGMSGTCRESCTERHSRRPGPARLGAARRRNCTAAATRLLHILSQEPAIAPSALLGVIIKSPVAHQRMFRSPSSLQLAVARMLGPHGVLQESRLSGVHSRIIVFACTPLHWRLHLLPRKERRKLTSDAALYTSRARQHLATVLL